MYPGKYRPTLTHSFIRLLASRRLLHKCFTQNIDMLERRAGVPNYKVVEARGSFASQKCIDCHEPYDDARMKECIRKKVVAHCEKCGGLVKPGIAFSDESVRPAINLMASKLTSLGSYRTSSRAPSHRLEWQTFSSSSEHP